MDIVAASATIAGIHALAVKLNACACDSRPHFIVLHNISGTLKIKPIIKFTRPAVMDPIAGKSAVITATERTHNLNACAIGRTALHLRILESNVVAEQLHRPTPGTKPSTGCRISAIIENQRTLMANGTVRIGAFEDEIILSLQRFNHISIARRG